VSCGDDRSAADQSAGAAAVQAAVLIDEEQRADLRVSVCPHSVDDARDRLLGSSGVEGQQPCE
jgi:hypothetical protein